MREDPELDNSLPLVFLSRLSHTPHTATGCYSSQGNSGIIWSTFHYYSKYNFFSKLYHCSSKKAVFFVHLRIFIFIIHCVVLESLVFHNFTNMWKLRVCIQTLKLSTLMSIMCCVSKQHTFNIVTNSVSISSQLFIIWSSRSTIITVIRTNTEGTCLLPLTASSHPLRHTVWYSWCYSWYFTLVWKTLTERLLCLCPRHCVTGVTSLHSLSAFSGRSRSQALQGLLLAAPRLIWPLIGQYLGSVLTVKARPGQLRVS